MYLDKLVPKMYKKNVLQIDYEKLYSLGIKCLLFDLDNTLAIIDKNEVSNDIRQLLIGLNKKFKIIVISNNFKKRIKPICNDLSLDYISFSLKPFSFKLNKITKKYGYKKDEICIIGDQLISDILGGYRFGVMTVLVDPLSGKDLKVTKLNRTLEKKIIKKLSIQNKLERGNYYD